MSSEEKKVEEKAVATPSVKLGDYTVPVVGLGTWKSATGEVGAAVIDAVKAGYLHIDCAAAYFNEAEVGEAFASILKEGKVKREDLFVTSKLWNSEHSPEDVKPALQKTLKELQLDYLDLYLIHWPTQFKKTPGVISSLPRDDKGNMIYNQVPLLDTWKALEACVNEGLVRNIGLSNFNSEQITTILEGCTIKPAMLQIECHPFFAQKQLLAFCQEHGIMVTGYSPLGSGSTFEGNNIPTHPKLAAIGKNYGKSAAQVALRYQLDRGVIVIPKSVKASRIAENLAVSDFKLTEDEHKIIAALDCNIRVGWGGPLVEGAPRDLVHADYPFLMDLETHQNVLSKF